MPLTDRHRTLLSELKVWLADKRVVESYIRYSARWMETTQGVPKKRAMVQGANDCMLMYTAAVKTLQADGAVGPSEHEVAAQMKAMLDIRDIRRIIVELVRERISTAETQKVKRKKARAEVETMRADLAIDRSVGEVVPARGPILIH